MRIKKIIVPVLIIFVFSLAVSLQAEEGKDLKGQFMFGYRSVSTSGALTKYKEDINLDDGMRLFNLSLHYTPSGALKKLVDRIDLRVFNFGGDPFETFSLSAQKYGKFKFQYDRKKAAYFYQDMYDTGGGALYDMHSLDFERIMDSGSFKYTLSKFAHFYLSFDRYTKKGDQVTTFDINRIEFGFDKPIREEYNQGTVGVDFHFNRYSFLYEYRVSDFETTNSLFLPGYADGGTAASYPSSLSLFFINQPYTLKSKAHVVKATARPFDSVLISGSAQVMDQDMSLSYGEQQKGVNYLGSCFEYGDSGKADFVRKIKNFDLDLTLMLRNNLAVIGAIRSDDFDQSGTFTTTVLGAMANPFGFNTLGIEAGLQYQFSSNFALTLGYRNEKRSLDKLMTVTYGDETTRNGLYGNFKLNFSRTFAMTVDYQRGSYEHPFTMISPSSFNRFRTTARFTAKKFMVSGVYVRSKITNDISGLPGWDSSKNQFNLRAGYHGAKFKLSGGYSSIKVDHAGTRDVAYPPGWSGPAGTFDWAIDFEGKSTILDGHLSFNLTEGWNLGGYFNSYKNSGFWSITRTMFKAFVEHTCMGGLTGQVGYRYVNFEETAKDNNYKANIIEFALGYRWK